MNYFLIFFMILILGSGEIISKRKVTLLKIKGYKFELGISFLMICLILFLISWYRDPLYGKDSINYYNAYEEIRAGIDVRSYEKGYLILEKIGNWMDLDYQAFIRLVAGLTYIPVFYVYGKRKGRMGILLFFVAMNYFGTFSVLRSYLSVAYLLLAYDFTLEKRIKKALICAIISILFHNLSLVYIFLLLLSRVKVKKGYWIILTAIVASVNIFRLHEVLLKIVGGVWKRYSVYSVNAAQISTVYAIILISIILLVFINKKRLVMNKENNILINYLYYITIITLFCPWFINYTRVIRLSFVFIAILFANILVCMGQKNRYVVYGFYSVILFGAMLLGQGAFINNAA